MKILCIARNYGEHIKELNNAVPESPVIFLKPDTALLKDGEDFYLPAFSKEVHYETELVVRIHKSGKKIDSKFAHKYYNEIGLGIDFTARDLQTSQKQKGLPWEIAKAFDGSAPVGKFFDKKSFADINNIGFSLKKNGQTVQEGNSKDMIYSIDTIIEYISQFVTLKTGDLIFTGTPVGVGKVEIGDVLEGFIEDMKVLRCDVK
jgi:acylpyruvate hydrolase